MPATPFSEARVTASRLCRKIGGEGFDVPGAHEPVSVTVSIGVTMGGTAKLRGLANEMPSALDLLDAADKALYEAKVQGRNQVNLARPAA